MANLQTWSECELSCSSDISDLLDKLVWLRLRYQDGKLIPARQEFHWNDAFFEELKVLRTAGGRGYIVLFDEHGSYYKYVLDDNEVRGYAGKVVFEGDVPEMLAVDAEDLFHVATDMQIGEAEYDYLKGRLNDLSGLAVELIVEEHWRPALEDAVMRLLEEETTK